jgi:hypothetical protein
VSLLSFCEWLAGSEWSIALHESLYLYPLLETTHVLSLLLFVSTVTFVDLRLLGWVFREAAVSEVTARLLPWTLVGLAISVVTGSLLFYAIPVRTFQSLFFRIKVVMLLAAGVNAALFHHATRKGALAWDRDPTPPLRARVAGAVSLVAWATVIVMGRMIAYNWFDCDRQPQPAFVNWAAGCILP